MKLVWGKLSNLSGLACENDYKQLALKLVKVSLEAFQVLALKHDRDGEGNKSVINLHI